jgi:CubicO group peptidase (beta-lactamase class C family)
MAVWPRSPVCRACWAGNLVGDAADWVVYLHQLLGGEASRAAQRRFARLIPMGLPGAGQAWYGLGAMAIDWIDSRNRARLWLGHTGGGSGANAVVFWDPWLNVYGAVAVNSPAPAAAVANHLLRTLELGLL